MLPKFKRRALAALVSSAVAGAALAGCGGGSTAPTVASLPGHANAGTHAATPLTQAQSDADMVNFTRCMRAHGVQMSDPFHRPGHAGLSVEIPPRTAANEPGYRACEPILQPLITLKEAHMRAVAAPTLAALTHYAECMRAHDISMLDPTWFGAVNLGNVPGITNDFGRDTPQFRAADSACRGLLPASVHDDGTGP